MEQKGKETVLISFHDFLCIRHYVYVATVRVITFSISMPDALHPLSVIISSMILRKQDYYSSESGGETQPQETPWGKTPNQPYPTQPPKLLALIAVGNL